jgi:hypothetical protein
MLSIAHVAPSVEFAADEHSLGAEAHPAHAGPTARGPEVAP